MPQVINITSRDFKLSAATEAKIREKIASLDSHYDRISHCDVIVEAPAIHHHHRGEPLTVRVRMTVPGAELIGDHQDDSDRAVAIRESFHAADRQLKEHASRLRGTI